MCPPHLHNRGFDQLVPRKLLDKTLTSSPAELLMQPCKAKAGTNLGNFILHCSKDNWIFLNQSLYVSCVMIKTWLCRKHKWHFCWLFLHYSWYKHRVLQKSGINCHSSGWGKNIITCQHTRVAHLKFGLPLQRCDARQLPSSIFQLAKTEDAAFKSTPENWVSSGV